ncbi:MAG: alpha/beta fold hydrolase [Xanthomonadales bacterium]|nr:alpha/beta fold hydrolase [Xanthomonadales bacterium]
MTAYRPPPDLYPFESHWLGPAGCRMHYLDEGPRDAPPVLMLHGNPTWSFYYRNLVLALRDRYRCIVPDHIGCGLSDKPGDEVYPYRLERRIEDIETLYEHLGIRQPLSLVVHDWGGMIGFGWAVRQRHRVARSVILNTAAFPMPAQKRFPLALWFAGRTHIGGWMVRRFNAFSGLAARIAFSKPVDRAVREAYTGPYDSWANRIATLRFVQDIPLRPGDAGYDIVARTASGLAGLDDMPALIAWGEKDFVFDEPFLAAWQRLLPSANVLRYPDCGHYVLEDAGPELVDQVAAFLDQAQSERV